jgi:dihydrodipicolinate synthase/N-acetylneuraminate lyase
MPHLQIGPINAATPTPLKGDGSFDKVSATRLCRHWIDLKLDGVFVLGSMGEGPLVSDQTREAFIETALDLVSDRLTLFISAVDVSFQRTRERVLRYAAMGAPCVVLCVSPGLSPGTAIRQIKAIADLSPVPCAYYEVPANTGAALNLHEIRDIISHPNICVLKDSSNNPLLAYGITSPEFRVPNTALLDGCEYRTVFSASVGYDGVMHGGGALTARRVRAIWDAVRNGDFGTAVQLDRENALFLGSVYNRFSRPLQNMIGQKYALKLLGVFDEVGVASDQTLDSDACARIRTAVEKDMMWLDSSAGCATA